MLQPTSFAPTGTGPEESGALVNLSESQQLDATDVPAPPTQIRSVTVVAQRPRHDCSNLQNDPGTTNSDPWNEGVILQTAVNTSQRPSARNAGGWSYRTARKHHCRISM